MARSLPMVALLLVAAVLASSRCMNACAFLSCDRPAESNHAGGQGMPCHGDQSPNPQPQERGHCSRHEILAEKRSIDALPDPMLAASFVAATPYDTFNRPACTSVVTWSSQRPLISRSGGLPSILRI